jgi:GTP-binding protein
MSFLQHARYAISAATLSQLPPSQAEVAFAGRSNAGKSSALNTLARHNRLAFVSKTPGCTQLINFFALEPNVYLVDLPGYGYAKVPLELRTRWGKVLSGYLQSREALRGMVLIMDARHPLTPLDWQMLEWFAPTNKPVHILLTKSDKLSRSEAIKTLAKVKKSLVEWPWVSTQLFSSLKNQGMDEAEAVIAPWLEIRQP